MSIEINHQTFEMLMDRFDRIDKDTQELKDLMSSHIEKDEMYYAKTDKHAYYFKALWLGFASLGGLLAALWGAISPHVFEKILK